MARNKNELGPYVPSPEVRVRRVVAARSVGELALIQAEPWNLNLDFAPRDSAEVTILGQDKVNSAAKESVKVQRMSAEGLAGEIEGELPPSANDSLNLRVGQLVLKGNNERPALGLSLESGDDALAVLSAEHEAPMRLLRRYGGPNAALASRTPDHISIGNLSYVPSEDDMRALSEVVPTGAPLTLEPAEIQVNYRQNG